jgi:NADP-dependent 3-hydroxy acid dehydrogenase YdfG
MPKLDGKVAVVTGASSGIGEATAEALAARGATVVVAARREERLADLTKRIEEGGGKVLAATCDVTDEAQAHGLIRQAEDEFGRVDILVNNAGVMKKQGGGHLVNVSSVAGRKVTRDSSGVYAGSKFAVGAISEGLRQELLAHNIRVTIVEPGAVATELTDHITDEDARESLGGLLNLEILQAEDIANAIVYAVTQPERVSVNEILIRPTQQPV